MTLPLRRCSGFGYMGMLLSEVLDPAKVQAIMLIDKAFALENTETKSTHINADHLNTPDWPIRMIVYKCTRPYHAKGLLTLNPKP